MLGAHPPRLQIPAIKIQFLSLLLLTPPAYSQVGQACVPSPRPYPDYWFVHTRACPQVMGTDPRPFLQASWLDSRGCLAMRDPADLAIHPSDFHPNAEGHALLARRLAQALWPLPALRPLQRPSPGATHHGRIPGTETDRVP